MSCLYLLKTANLSGRLARWAVQLSDYDFTVSYTPGKENVVADALSRAEFINRVSGDDEPTEKDRQMNLPQSKDFYLGPILLYKHKQKFPADMSKRNSRIVAKESESFRLTKGVLY